MFQSIHHVAVIVSNYERSKEFYVRILGLEVLKETHRPERDSYKLDLTVNGQYQIELFSFPNPPPRVSNPEAAGLRHLAFATDDICAARERLAEYGVKVEQIRTDELTGKEFFFFWDPDGLPLEVYQS